MSEDASVVRPRQPETIDDPLTEIAPAGARRMLASALEVEVGAFLGALAVRRPKIRDRAAEAKEKVRFTSRILPTWARRSTSLDALLPVPYLRGVSTGDFQAALAALLGPDAPTLSPGVVTRLAAPEMLDAQDRQRAEQG